MLHGREEEAFSDYAEKKSMMLSRFLGADHSTWQFQGCSQWQHAPEWATSQTCHLESFSCSISHSCKTFFCA